MRVALWIDCSYSQDLCHSLAGDSTITRVTSSFRCDPIVTLGLQHGAAGKCWYSWSLNGRESIIPDYLMSAKRNFKAHWLYAPTSSPNDSLLSGSYFISKRKYLVIVEFDEGYVSIITHRTNNSFVRYDFSVMNECQLPIVVQTAGNYYDIFQSSEAGWHIEVSTIVHEADGTTTRINGCYSQAIRSRRIR